MSSDPFVVDPTQIGPFDRCLTCFTPRNDEIAYCTHCGRTTFFQITETPPKDTVCTYHPNVSAKTYCVLCGNAICAACIKQEGVSLMTALPTPQCHTCLARAAELEAEYRRHLEDANVCAKHPNEPAALRCIKCDLPHCGACLYFTTTGWLRKRLGTGPLCLGCFRSNVFGATRQHWVSLRDAKERKMLRGVDPRSLL